MCGIAGIIDLNTENISHSRLKSMTDIIAHRGPDGDGHWISSNKRVGLGHRRLSIIDLSHEADQPMHFVERYHLVFNGEIYNYLELKETLIKQGYAFATVSDTEVLLALYDRDKENCLQLLDGMFSFVIYDELKNEIFAARDRFGEKPFFYHYQPGKHFMFGSEMKCLWEGGVEKKVNNRMLYNYLINNSLDNPNDLSETFYENCTRLPHGHFLKLSVSNCSLSIKQYYDIEWRNVNHSITIQQAKDKFQDLFYTSVRRRLRSDVAVGSSLSGGLDSSLVVAVINSLKKGTVQKQETFSAIFPGFKKDERRYIDYVTATTNVNPHFVIPDDEGLVASLNKLSWHQEEPFGSASIYVQYCVMQLAKENNVTVLLDGQGADEVLAGYHVYYPEYFKELTKSNPKLYKQEIKAYADKYADSEINKNYNSSFANRVKYAAGNALPKVRKWYHQVKDPFAKMLDQDFKDAYKINAEPQHPFSSLNERLYYSSFKQGLQELLRYADRNSMAHSREVRLPFLYNELVEFLFTLPAHMKINDGWTKWIMRSAFEADLPAEICWRKDKIGYEPPQKNWMETKTVKNKITEATQKLKDRNILSASGDSKPIQSASNNWKLLMAGELF